MITCCCMCRRRVAIIGAGVAGLQAARALQKWGIDFTIFEEYDDVGGYNSRSLSSALMGPWRICCDESAGIMKICHAGGLQHA